VYVGLIGGGVVIFFGVLIKMLFTKKKSVYEEL